MVRVLLTVILIAGVVIALMLACAEFDCDLFPVALPLRPRVQSSRRSEE